MGQTSRHHSKKGFKPTFKVEGDDSWRSDNLRVSETSSMYSQALTALRQTGLTKPSSPSSIFTSESLPLRSTTQSDSQESLHQPLAESIYRTTSRSKGRVRFSGESPSSKSRVRFHCEERPFSSDRFDESPPLLRPASASGCESLQQPLADAGSRPKEKSILRGVCRSRPASTAQP